ncbi:type II secretion system protein GspM [Alcaligenes sp.]|uniref:type II secretion system protein GspM n=1 Tax=Alcaligenes sp. TaxID=512 RepID=UPI003B6A31F4|nr:type II secretion system protein M [Klebsiella pneumoniae]
MTGRLSLFRSQGVAKSIRKFIAPANAVITRWRNRVQPSVSQAVNRWHGLRSRERQQVLVMLGVLIAAVLWLLFTKPALDSLRYWADEMPRLRSQAVALQDVLADVSAPPSASGAFTQSASERIRESLEQRGFDGAYQVRSSGSEIVVQIEHPVTSTQLVAWLMIAPPTIGLSVKQVTLQRDHSTPAAQTSQITATVTLAEQQQQPRNGS